MVHRHSTPTTPTNNETTKTKTTKKPITIFSEKKKRGDDQNLTIFSHHLSRSGVVRPRKAYLRKLQVSQGGGVGLHPLRRPVPLSLAAGRPRRGADTAIVEQAARALRDRLEMSTDPAEEAPNTATATAVSTGA